jgi:YD repeat-containing protein
MVGIVTGQGTGLERSSASVLGFRGQAGSSLEGRGGDGVYVNAATGNLVITRQDEVLLGLGPDIAISRTYNSQATVADGDNDDNWRISAYRRIVGANGSATVTRVDWDGSESVYVQNGASYICRDGEGAYDTLAWDGAQWLWTDGGSRATETYDATGKLLAARDADGNSLTYTYTGSLITRIVDQDGEYTDLVYGGTGGNQLQRITTQTSTGSVRVRYSYDGSNRLSTVTVDLSPADGAVADGNGYVTTYTYDGTSKRVASIAQSDGSRLDIAYTPSGSDYRVTKLTQTVSGGVTRVTGLYYDLAGRTTTVTDPLGGATTMRYDASGNLTQIAYPVPAPGAAAPTTSFAYNANGDLVSVTEGGRTTAYQYDAGGNMVLSRDAAGNTVSRTYGTKNELLTSSEYVVPDPDAAGPAAAATPLTARYAYDSENHLRFRVSGDGRVAEFRYNAAGSLIATLRYAANLYDTTGLAATSSISESTLAAWAAAVGDKTTIERTDTAYDFRGNVSTLTSYSKTLADGSGDLGSTYTRTIYVYDQAGNLLSRQVTGQSGFESFVYDGLNRVVSSTDAAGAVTSFAFNDAATTTTVTLAGSTRVSVFNKAGERVSFTESGGDISSSVTTGAYDALGRLRMQTDPTGRATYFIYDGASRKVADIGADGAMTEYGYDDGNRLVKAVSYMNRLSTSQIALLSNISAGGAGGAAAGGVSAPAGPNLLSNGSFDQSGSYTATSTGRSNTDLPGWIKSNAETFEQVASGLMGVAASDGAYWLDLESVAKSGVMTIGSNLLTNGSFELSGTYVATATGRSNTNLPGWTKSNAETFEQVASGQMGVNASDGSYWLDLESIAKTGMMTVGSNLLVNGSFDQSGSYTATATGRSNTTLPGWTKANAETFEQVASGQMGVTGTDGAYWLDMESTASPGPQPVGSNLLVNGSFELSTSFTQTASGRTSTAIPGWSKTNPEAFDQVLAETTNLGVTDGIYWLDLDSVPGSGGMVAGPNLIVNGSFEQSATTYTTTATGRSNSATLNIPGWTKTNSQGFEQVNSGVDGVTATNGSFYLDMEAAGGFDSRMDISQTIGGLAGSQQLTLKFDYANKAGLVFGGEDYENSGSLEVYWNGFLIARVTAQDAAMTTKAFTVTSVAGNNTLRFREIGITDGKGVYLDNVQLYGMVPAPNGGNMDISQTVSNLTAGQVMQLQFDHTSRTTSASGSFEVYWNNALVASVTDGGGAWKTKSYFVNAIAGNNILRFKGIGTVDALGAALDNVRLFATQTAPHGGNMDISQTVSNLTAGQVLQLQFDHANRTTSASGSFEVWWNNALVATVTDTGAAMQTKTYVLTAVAGNNALRFKSTGTVDANGASLDNVRLLAMQPVPSGGNMDISQTVGGLAAGQVMQLQFDHANRTTAASGSFEVWWNSTLVATVTDTGAAMQTKTYLVTAIAGNNTLRFKSLGTVDDAGASLDNVRLLATQPVPSGGNMDISQTVGGLAAGQVMQLEFDHANRTTSASGSFEVYWNNALVATIAETGTAMQAKTYFVTAVAGNNTLRFKSLGTVDDAGASIDNVRLFAMQGGGPGGTSPVDPLAGLRPTAAANDDWTWRIYDAADRLIETIDGAGRATTFAYDGASRLVSSTVYANAIAAATVAGFKTTTPTASVLPADNAATDRATRSFYDSGGRLVGTLDGAGGLSQVFHDAAGQEIREIAYANPAATSLRASGTFAQLLASVGTSASDRRADHVYDQRGLLRFTIDSAGHPTEFVYDAAGRLIRTVDYAGAIATSASYSLAYVQGQISATGLASNAANRITRSVYDGAGRLAFAINAEGGTSVVAYDQLGNPIMETRYLSVFTAAGDQTLAAMQSWAAGQAGNAGNRVTRQVYDAAGRMAYAVDAEGYVTERRYDTAGRVTQAIRYPSAYSVSDGVTKTSLAAQIGALPAEAVVTSYAYDAAGRLTDLTDGAGIVIHYVYDALSQVTDETVAYGTADAATLRRAYDAAGRVVSETRGYGTAEAATTTYGYDALGNLLTVTDPRSFTTVRSYDALGRVLTRTAPIDASTNAITSNVYNRFGDVVQTTDALGFSSYRYYDRLGRIVATRDAENYVTETGYSAFSDVTSVTRRYNPANNAASTAVLPTYAIHTNDATTSFVYDKLGRLVKATDAEGHYEQYTLDAFGQQVIVRNKLGGTTINAFDRRGLLVAETLPMSSVRSDGSIQAATVINRFEYDSRGNRTRMIEASGLSEQRTSTYIYDKVDRMVETRGDAVAVLSQSDHYSQSTVTPTERLIYDRRGNLIETVDTLGARTLLYYDQLNRRIADLNAVGTLTTYGRDANGNVTSARAYAAAVALPGSAGGTPPAAPAGEYRETTSTYDRLNRLLTRSVTGVRTGAWNGAAYVTSVGTVTTTYQYDANGNVTKATDQNGGVTWAYYDKLGRTVTTVDGENFLTSWTYDAEGNALTERRAAQQATGVGTSAPLASPHPDDRVTNFTYDRNGRRLAEQRMAVSAYEVNNYGVLTYTPSAVSIVYAYDGLGQVTRKTEATGELIDYIYDSAGRLVTENRASYTDQAGNFVRPTVDYAYDGLNQLTRTRQGNQSAAAGDRITRNDYGPGGRLASVTDATGSAYSYAYDAGGNVLRESYARQKADGSSVGEAILYTRDMLGRTTSRGVAAQNDAGWIRGDAQTIAYNAFGEVSKRGLNGLWQEQFDYDRAGQLWRTNSQDGVWRYFIQDGNGNQTAAIESEGTDLANQTIDQVLAIATGNGAHAVGAAYVDGINASINVYDKRSQATSTRLAKRQLSEGGAVADLTVSRGYTAFGEIAWEMDAKGARTDFGYNTMGRTVSVRKPMASVTLENGAVQNANPTEYFFYDVSGRLIGMMDANGNGTNRMLLAGTGYGDDEGVAVLEFHPDGGIIRSAYDVFGDLRKSTDEVNRVTEMSYDARGRLTQVTRPSGLVENFAYDLLGQRISHWNNVLQNPVYGPPEDVWVEDPDYWDPDYGWVDGGGHWETHTPIVGYAPDKELTDYDLQGRVTRQVAFGGDTTTTSYAWSSALATSGMGTFGGWIQTTTHANGLSATEHSDMFGRDLYKMDLGGHQFSFSYDLAGRLAQRTGGDAITYSYLNSGLLGSLTSLWGVVDDAYDLTRTVYGYDANGNKISEQFEKEGAHWVYYGPYYGDPSEMSAAPPEESGAPPDEPMPPGDIYALPGGGWDDPPDPELVPYGDVYQNATATYDALGRMTSWTEAGNGTTPAAQILYDYDANGNVRRTRAQYSALNGNGTVSAGASKDHWYRYDSSNRVVTSKGVLQGSQIQRGYEGTDIAYDKSGQRVSTTRTMPDTAWVWDPNAQDWSDPWNPTYGAWVPIGYDAEVREQYGYDAGGYLATVRIARSGYSDNGDGTITVLPPPATGELKASHTHDVMGRLTRQIDWLSDGANAAYDRTISYNGKGQVNYEVIISKQGWETIRVNTTHEFGSGAGYALGAVTRTVTENFKNGSLTHWTTTDNTYVWFDGAMQSTIRHNPNVWQSTVFTTNYSYNGWGQLQSVWVGDGRPRSVTFTNNIAGQAIRRDEADNNYSNGDPHEVWYRFNGRQLGFTGNNGTLDTDYQSSINTRTQTQGNGPFRFGMTYGSAYADFDQNYSPINSYGQGSAGGSYTARAGDTLSSIAASLWGDGSLWYKLAEANGMTASSGLVEGQRLTVPTGVLKNHHNASTFKPYDPSDVLGDVNPTTPRPPTVTQKKNNCGIFGQILLVIVAVAVSVLTYGALSGPAAGLFGSTFGPIVAGAASGAAGAAASQAFGVATGIQDRFDWKAVALGALSGAVGGAVQSIPFLKAGGGKFTDFAKDVARGALASAVTQGIGVATGLQGKFSWAGVASAGVGAGVSGALARGFDIKNLKTDRSLANIGRNMLLSSASAIAAAATESVIEGTDFGDNLLGALPGVIGGTIGNVIGHHLLAELQAPPKPKPAPRAPVSNGAFNRRAQGAFFMNASWQQQQGPVIDGVVLPPITDDGIPPWEFDQQPVVSRFYQAFMARQNTLGGPTVHRDIVIQSIWNQLFPNEELPCYPGRFDCGDEVVTGTTTESGSVADLAPALASLLSLNQPRDFGLTFRGDARAPSVIFNQGFKPLGTSTNVLLHALDNRYPPSAYVSTSTSYLRATTYGGGQYVYVVHPTNGFDVNRILGRSSPYPLDFEIANRGPILPRDVRGVTLPNQGVSILNPNYLAPSRGTIWVGRATTGLRFTGTAGTVILAYQDVNRINDVYQADSRTGNYTNTAWKAAEVGGSWGGMWIGAKVGAYGGAKLGLLGGPKAWITVPAGTIIGAGVGGYLGYHYGGEAVNFMRPDPLIGVELDSPMPDMTPPGSIGGRPRSM